MQLALKFNLSLHPSSLSSLLIVILEAGVSYALQFHHHLKSSLPEKKEHHHRYHHLLLWEGRRQQETRVECDSQENSMKKSE